MRGVVISTRSISVLSLLSLMLASPGLVPLSALQRTAEERKTARTIPIDAAIHVDGVLEERTWRQSMFGLLSDS